MSDINSLISSVPPLTRTILLGILVVTGPCLLSVISPRDLALTWFRVARKGEIWRPITAFLFGGGGFPFIFDFFLIYRNSSSLERDTYLSNIADYVWVHVVLAGLITTFNIPFSFPFLFRPLLHAQNYIWCRANPTLKVSLFGLITLPTGLYPFALLALDIITGGPAKALNGLLGVLAAHTWWFLSVFLPLHAPPQLRRSNPLRTPGVFRNLFATANATSSTTAWGGTRIVPPRDSDTSRGAATQSAANAARHRWGSGQRLGGQKL